MYTVLSLLRTRVLLCVEHPHTNTLKLSTWRVHCVCTTLNSHRYVLTLTDMLKLQCIPRRSGHSYMALRTVADSIVSAEATAAGDESSASTTATAIAESTLNNGVPPHNVTVTGVTAVTAATACAAPVPITRLASTTASSISSASSSIDAFGVRSLMSDTRRWTGARLNSAAARRHTFPRAAAAAAAAAAAPATAASATATSTTSTTTAQSHPPTASNTSCSGTDSSADSSSSSSSSADPIVVYISHRWLEPEFSDCDDEHRCKYFQVLSAVAQLAQRMQQPLNRFHLWIDYSCADQVCLSHLLLLYCTI
jgi:hypothetical protein